jgi:predicted ester cyclase
MSIETNKAVVRRYLEVMINGGDTSIADELFVADYVNHTAGSGISTGAEGMARSIRAVKTAFPDWHVRIDALVAEGGMVEDRFTISATHTGSVNGIAPTGQKIDALGMHMWRLTNGKLAEGWYLTDAMPMVAAALVPSP